MAIQWSPRAVREVRRIAPAERQRIIARIEQYAADPESLTNQVIVLATSRYRRLRVGDYR